MEATFGLFATSINWFILITPSRQKVNEEIQHFLNRTFVYIYISLIRCVRILFKCKFFSFSLPPHFSVSLAYHIYLRRWISRSSSQYRFAYRQNNRNYSAASNNENIADTIFSYDDSRTELF